MTCHPPIIISIPPPFVRTLMDPSPSSLTLEPGLFCDVYLFLNNSKSYFVMLNISQFISC